MDLNALLQQARAARGNTNSVILKAGEPAGHAPWEMFVTEEHTEHYLALKAGGETYRGIATGLAGGWITLPFLVLAIAFALKPDMKGVLISLAFASLVIPVFFWEISQPLPLPILLNRRTRELYYQHEGELFHMPWDEAQALACAFITVGPQSGGMGHASLDLPLSLGASLPRVTQVFPCVCLFRRHRPSPPANTWCNVHAPRRRGFSSSIMASR